MLTNIEKSGSVYTGKLQTVRGVRCQPSTSSQSFMRFILHHIKDGVLLRTLRPVAALLPSLFKCADWLSD